MRQHITRVCCLVRVIGSSSKQADIHSETEELRNITVGFLDFFYSNPFWLVIRSKSRLQTNSYNEFHTKIRGIRKSENLLIQFKAVTLVLDIFTESTFFHQVKAKTPVPSFLYTIEPSLRAMLLRILDIILIVLRLEVSYTMFTLQSSFKSLLLGGGGVKFVTRGDCE